MKTIHSQIDIQIPEDVKVTLKSRHIVVSGKYGKLERTFRHIPVDMKLVEDGRKITVEMWFGLTKNKACIRTVCSHIENMITGVRQRYQYKLRFVYAHFPINSNITNDGSTIEIRNFLGEKVVRTVDMMPGVSVRKSDDVKDEVIVEGADLELVSRSAALIHQSTLVRHKDIRKFLDGIYVTESGVIDQLEE
ncbi:60S ribosomal protein L6, putative [Perkinsus marinus ATCC 50983]|uniref:60S ribosomal protein L6, putative n=1 Tax=Perkinsus marinus (strain ATCC 50983 / TXsc) TaxID=423536 RepID=C5LIT9_PERM5|nr:60S ribosomal protein L6, putative [Perkinsus marinus ATCC 50983]XP_002771676.1 60S ribosomal protein L6, putative [Perkinsus marinus ATCC 50983]EER01893.1 60S ribosomal protein L6, putative [Perkinsus marinus ATCC 50983]EER03492.1 60S ribosomal protein L6, putative [Perkinsus marinus ATCC 50983]|eukprot:XP_002769175.1 60S ribosomal protein L6, putative [Perkinsus marinus ATCC 50983]